MKKILFVFLGLASILIAGQKYNAFEHRWETVPDDWQTQYNPYEHTWSYQPPDAQVEYNPFEHSWDWDSGHNFGGHQGNNAGWYE